MIILAVMLGLVAGALWMGSRRKGAITFGALAAILLFIAAIAIVPPGHVGVPVVFGRVSDAALYEGLHLVNPLATVERFSVRTETYSMNSSAGEGGRSDDSIYVLSSDGVAMPMDVSVAYRLVDADARGYSVILAGATSRVSCGQRRARPSPKRSRSTPSRTPTRSSGKKWPNE